MVLLYLCWKTTPCAVNPKSGDKALGDAPVSLL